MLNKMRNSAANCVSMIYPGIGLKCSIRTHVVGFIDEEEGNTTA